MVPYLKRPGGVVVEEEERLGSADEDVVDAHGHEVHADGVVLAHRLRDLELRPHAVRARHKHRIALVVARLRHVKQAMTRCAEKMRR
jgi:hypothetical protein